MKSNLKKLKNPNTSTFDALIKFLSFALTKPGYQFIRKHILRALSKANILYEGKMGQPLSPKDFTKLYNEWLAFKLDPIRVAEEYIATRQQLAQEPKISIILPVYEPQIYSLEKTIESIIVQSYHNWELCIADDNSLNVMVQSTLLAYAGKDKRVKVLSRKECGGLSACSNTALEWCTGDFVLPMQQGDLLTPNCLFEIAKHINKFPGEEIIYSDEDNVDDQNVFSNPHFKSDWAPDTLLSRNYIGNAVVLKKYLVNSIGGFRTGFEGSLVYDLILRASEKAKGIGHIAEVLYHSHIDEASIPQDKKVIEDALLRRQTPGSLEDIPHIEGRYTIKYDIQRYDKVSIIIPTKDQVELLSTSIDSILNKTSYPNYEIIVLNNNSTTPQFYDLINRYLSTHGNIFRCIEAHFPFNYSRLMNIGVAESSGEYILLLNNDVEVIHDDWMTQMVSYAQRKHTGIVGVKLLYPDNTIQHAGVVLGFGGAATHIFTNIGRYDTGYFNNTQLLSNYAAVTAACIMFRKATYLEVGGMDENLPVEYNDVDLCLKMYDKGYYNVYLPSVELYHYESATRDHPYSSKAAWAQHEKDITYFGNKWPGLIKADPFYNPNFGFETNCYPINLKTARTTATQP